MGSSPYGRNHLLGIAHPVVGKIFQVLKIHPEVNTYEELVEKGGRFGIVMYFVNFG